MSAVSSNGHSYRCAQQIDHRTRKTSRALANYRNYILSLVSQLPVFDPQLPLAFSQFIPEKQSLNPRVHGLERGSVEVMLDGQPVDGRCIAGLL